MPCACSNSRCGCDFSTRAKRLPNLASIEVVSDIFYQAAVKSVQRAKALEEGEMSPEEVSLGDERLINWLGTTFCGNNPHYGSSEGWNPSGLAEFARQMLREEMREAVGTVPEDDEEAVFAAAKIYMNDLYAALERRLDQGLGIDGFILSEANLKLVQWWSRLMTGAPVELLLRS